jgi:hypothetical protein
MTHHNQTKKSTTWFLKDHRPSVGKLDPQAVKCIFVVYSSTQKGYKYWDPVERKLFVSMDVTFQMFVPYYTNKDDLDQFLEEFSSVTESDSREGENNYGHSSGDNDTQYEIVGTIPSSHANDDVEINEVVVDSNVEDNEVVDNNVEDNEVVIQDERSNVENNEVVVVGTLVSHKPKWWEQ